MVAALAMPIVFALLGIILIAVAALGPRRSDLHPAVSFAPPVTPPPLARWARPRGWYPPRPRSPEPTPAADDPRPATWPERIDARAAGCSAQTRIALVEALATIATPWAVTVLREAFGDDHDPSVRAAILSALALAAATHSR